VRARSAYPRSRTVDLRRCMLGRLHGSTADD